MIAMVSLIVGGMFALALGVFPPAANMTELGGGLGRPITLLYLSDLPWVVATNGAGPVQKDANAADGHTLSINGTTYATGLGTRAPSDVRYGLQWMSAAYGDCTTFTTDVGVDDATAGRGSVVFQVWADGTKLYDSGTMSGSIPARKVALDVTGKAELGLVVTDAGDGGAYDYADWANARLLCGAVVPATVTRAIGGDTLDAQILGVRTAVGYLGVETPAANQPCGQEALARNRELADGNVFLRADPLYLVNPAGLRVFYAYTSAGVWIDEVLIREGLGRAVHTDASFGSYLAAIQTAAQATRTGCLWKQPVVS